MTEEIKTEPAAGEPSVAVPSSPQGRTGEVREKGEQELWLKAKQWVDSHSGRQTWRVLRVTRSGFFYDGPFFAPQFMSWELVDFGDFDRLAGFAAE